MEKAVERETLTHAQREKTIMLGEEEGAMPRTVGCTLESSGRGRLAEYR